jgi:Lon-like ATP-dependent protease
MGQAGIPQPKQGAVTNAHGGVLFIDEIGELHPIQMNKLLKVLEDRKVYLESAYYHEENVNIPPHIHDIFQNGLPADFRLIGATTRMPEEIPPAIRSRCLEVFFSELKPGEVKRIARRASEKIKLGMEDSSIDFISQYAKNGREAVNMVQIAAGHAITENRDHIEKSDVEWVVHSSRMSPRPERKIGDEAKVGHVNGLAVYGPASGALLEIETTVLPTKSKGAITITGIVEEESIGSQSKSIRRKSMAKSSAENVLTVLKMMGVNTSSYDIHVNFPGGGPVDGPSAGIAMAVSVYSAIHEIKVSHEVAMTGELSIHGKVKPVGGVLAKVQAAKEAGAKRVIIPEENYQKILESVEGIEILPVTKLSQVFHYAFAEEESEMSITASAILKNPPASL